MTPQHLYRDFQGCQIGQIQLMMVLMVHVLNVMTFGSNSYWEKGGLMELNTAILLMSVMN